MLAQAIKRRLSKEENQKGFTLIELLAVIVILGIIAVIAIPLIGGVIDRSKEDSDVATARQLYEAARLYVIGEGNGDFTGTTVTLAQLRAGHYIDSNIYLPSTKAPITAANIVFGTTGELASVMITPIAEAADASGAFTPQQVLSSEPSPSPTTTP